MPERGEILFGVIGVLGFLTIISLLFLDVKVGALELLVIAGISGLSIMQFFDQEFYRLATKEARGSGALDKGSEGFNTFDQLWDELQEWYSKDPRNGELVWKDGLSKIDSTVPDSVDGKFRFLAILTPSKDTGNNVFCCIETTTKSILTWDEKGKVNRDNLFESVTLVKDLRRKNSVSEESVRNRVMSNRVASLGSAGFGFQNPAMTRSGSDRLEALDQDDNGTDGDDE